MGELVEFRGSLLRDTADLHGIQAVVGGGSEHLVLSHTYFDQLARGGDLKAAIVQKVSHVALSECNSGTPSENMAKSIELAERRNQRYAQLRAAFAEGVIPAEETLGCRLWLTTEEIEEFLSDWPGPTSIGGVFYTTISWQDKVWELDPEYYDPANVLQFRIPYAELQPRQPDGDTYAAVSDRWISLTSEGEAPTKLEISQLLSVQNSRWLGKILDSAKSNPNIAVALGKIIEGSIKHGRLSGQSLDFMGENNAIVTTDGQARLIDVLMLNENPMLQQLPAVLGKIAISEGLRRKEIAILLNSVGHVRTVNFLAAWLGLPDRLDLNVPQLRSTGWKMIQRILNAYSSSKDLVAATGPYPY